MPPPTRDARPHSHPAPAAPETGAGPETSAAPEAGAPPETSAPPKPRRAYAPRMAPAQRREQLLDAALSVIVTQGYERISMEAVARAAGVTRPVVYDHFADLGALLRALIEREERYSIAQLEHVIPERPEQLEPAEVLTQSVRRFIDAVSSRPDTWTIILLAPEGTPEIVRQHVEANRAQMLARMQAVVRWGLERNQALGHFDVELAARAVLGLAEDAGRMVLTDPERYSPDRYEQFVQWVMKLLWVQ